MRSDRTGRRVHDQVVKQILNGWFSSEAWKGFVFSLVVGGLGFAGHYFLSQHDVQASVQVTLDQHSKEISDLLQSSKDTTVAINQLNVTTTRIEGKIDTLNQKIDDDRQQHKLAYAR